MKIFVTGTRGIPDIPGGVERHCQELYPRIVAAGHKVILATRRSYVKRALDEYKGIELKHVFAPRMKSLEAIVHTTLSLAKARLVNPDIVHIHAIGPSLLVPLAKLMGLKVVVTNHGPDYERQKWGRLAKMFLRAGEWAGSRWADQVIVISKVIQENLRQKYGRKSWLVPNGVVIDTRKTGTEYLSGIGVEPGRYILAVARFVPEKGLHDLLAAFKTMDTDIKLVIAGDADHETAYSRRLKQQAGDDDRVVLTGYITGKPLKEVFAHAGLFVMPSYHEGHPIALLEALSFGRLALVSDIPANKEIGLDQRQYFECGNVRDLRGAMEKLLRHRLSDNERREIVEFVRQKYDWDKIAAKTLDVYVRALA